MSENDKWPNAGVDDEFHFNANDPARAQPNPVDRAPAKPVDRAPVKPVAKNGPLNPSPEILKLRSRAQKIMPTTRSVTDAFSDPDRYAPADQTSDPIEPIKNTPPSTVQPLSDHNTTPNVAAPPKVDMSAIGRKAAKLKPSAIGSPLDPPMQKIVIPEPPEMSPNRPSRPMPEKPMPEQEESVFGGRDPASPPATATGPMSHPQVDRAQVPELDPRSFREQLAQSNASNGATGALPAASMSHANALKPRPNDMAENTTTSRRPLPKTHANEQRLSAHLALAKDGISPDPAEPLVSERKERSMVPFVGVLGGIAIICAAMIGGFLATSGSDSGSDNGSTVATLGTDTLAPVQTAAAPAAETKLPEATLASEPPPVIAVQTQDAQIAEIDPLAVPAQGALQAPIQGLTAQTEPLDPVIVSSQDAPIVLAENTPLAQNVLPITPAPLPQELSVQPQLDQVATLPSSPGGEDAAAILPSSTQAPISTIRPNAGQEPAPQLSAVIATVAAPLPDPDPIVSVAPSVAKPSMPTVGNQLIGERNDAALPQLGRPALPTVQVAMQTTAADSVPNLFFRDPVNAFSVSFLLNGSDTLYGGSGPANMQIGAVLDGIYARPAAPYPLDQTAGDRFAGQSGIIAPTLQATLMTLLSSDVPLTAGAQMSQLFDAPEFATIQTVLAAAVQSATLPDIDFAPATPLPNSAEVEVASAAASLATNAAVDAPADTAVDTAAASPEQNPLGTITVEVARPVDQAKPLPDIPAPLARIRWTPDWGVSTTVDPAGAGIVITAVDATIAPSWAKPDQVITAINGWQVNAPSDIAYAIGAPDVDAKSGLGDVPITYLDAAGVVQDTTAQIGFARLVETGSGTQLMAAFDGRKWVTRVTATGPDSDFEVGDVIVRDFGARERFNYAGALERVFAWADSTNAETISFAVLRNDAVDTASMALNNAPLEQ